MGENPDELVEACQGADDTKDHYENNRVTNGWATQRTRTERK